MATKKGWTTNFSSPLTFDCFIKKETKMLTTIGACIPFFYYKPSKNIHLVTQLNK